MGVDLHRIGTTISRGTSNNGFGTIVSFPSVAPSFPEYGELLETLTAQEYPISEGGSYLTINAVNYPIQVADVDRLADGVGGSFLDWTNISNVAYKSNGNTITTASGSHFVTINGINYSVGSYTTTYYHDGSGGYYELTDNSYSTYGTYLAGQNGVTSYINIAGTDYANGSYDINYYSDGAGSYYSSNENASYTSNGIFIVGFNNQTEVPSGSNSYFDNGTTTEYYHDGSGGYYSSSGGSYYSSGTFITNYSGTDYYWDGSGGFYF
jgi:hypothetical protein